MSLAQPMRHAKALEPERQRESELFYAVSESARPLRPISPWRRWLVRLLQLELSEWKQLLRLLAELRQERLA